MTSVSSVEIANPPVKEAFCLDPEKKKDYSDYTAFISYRRVGGEGFARLLYEKLRQAGVTAFYDVDSLRNGRFDINLLNSINDCDNFILVLSKDSMNWKRLRDRKDFVRREIEHALKHHKNIIPVMLDGFSWSAVKLLPDSMYTLPLYNGLDMHSAYSGNLFDAFMQDLLAMLVKLGEPGPAIKNDEKLRRYYAWQRLKRILLYVGIGILAAAAAVFCLLSLPSDETPPGEPVPEENVAYVYLDAGADENRYDWPSKMDGTNGALVHDIDFSCAEGQHDGTTCMRCHLDTEPGSWGGWMLLNGYVPEDGTGRILNDGKTPDQGEDLSGMTALRFFARGENGGEKVEFFCCGFGYDEKNIPQNIYNDSAFKQSLGAIELTKKWTEYTIPFPDGTNLNNISCGFGFVCSGAENGTAENTFYLDDIRYCTE